jgi:hypothetical protein
VIMRKLIFYNTPSPQTGICYGYLRYKTGSLFKLWSHQPD